VSDFLVCFSVVVALHCAVASDVRLLDSTNVSLISEGSWLVEIYAPWCGYCKKIAPTYETIATKLKGTVQVAKIDGDRNTDLAIRFQISGYPTFFCIQNGDVYHYDGPRTEQDIISFVQSGYKQATKLPFYSSPLSFVGEALGLFGKFGVTLSNLSDFLRDEYQLSQGTVSAIAIAVLVVLISAGVLLALGIASALVPSTPPKAERSKTTSSDTTSKSKKKE